MEQSPYGQNVFEHLSSADPKEKNCNLLMLIDRALKILFERKAIG